MSIPSDVGFVSVVLVNVVGISVVTVETVGVVDMDGYVSVSTVAVVASTVEWVVSVTTVVVGPLWKEYGYGVIKWSIAKWFNI